MTSKRMKRSGEMKRLLISGFIFLILCALLMVKCSHSIQENKEQKQHHEEVEKYKKERKKGINMKVLNSLYGMKETAMR